MISRVIAWSLKNRFLVLLGTVAVIGAGVWAMRSTPLDAIPDLSDVQVIVQTTFSEQAPQIVEDQVTYPIATEMLKVPGSRVVRGFSFFGVSFVYVIFEDGTDIYWARSRVLEYLKSRMGQSEEATNLWYRHWIAEGFAALEQAIGKHTSDGRHCFGDTVTMADVCLVPQVYNARRFAVDLAAYPALVRVSESLESLPPFAEARPEAQPDAE
jgi:Cu(I)/Ag(I) efflux system membrane protein CusA/SilA